MTEARICLSLQNTPHEHRKTTSLTCRISISGIHIIKANDADMKGVQVLQGAKASNSLGPCVPECRKAENCFETLVDFPITL